MLLPSISETNKLWSNDQACLRFQTLKHDLRNNHTDRSPTRSITVRPINSSRQLVARHNITTPTTARRPTQQLPGCRDTLSAS